MKILFVSLGCDKNRVDSEVMLGMLSQRGHEFTDDEKSQMYHDTIMALNCGSDEAMECAFEIRLKALCSGDEEFIEKIEYLHEVL